MRGSALPRFLTLSLALSVPVGALSAQQPSCTNLEAKYAETEADTLRSWDALHRSYQTYARCDDGAIAEGYSESVARILVDHWATLPRLDEIAKKDPSFQDFVLKHVDETLAMNDVKAIQMNATRHCPSHLGRFCRQLRKRATTP